MIACTVGLAAAFAGPLSVLPSVSRTAVVTMQGQSRPTAPDEAVDLGGMHSTGIRHSGQTTWDFRHGAGGQGIGMMAVPLVGKVVPTNQAKPVAKKPAVHKPDDAFRHGAAPTAYGQTVSSGMHRVHLSNPDDTFRFGAGGQALGNDESQHWYGVMPNRMVD